MIVAGLHQDCSRIVPALYQHCTSMTTEAILVKPLRLLQVTGIRVWAVEAVEEAVLNALDLTNPLTRLFDASDS